MNDFSNNKMSSLGSCHSPGILLVLSQPRSPAYLADFHDWYDTEHGPARLKLGSEYFLNGYRYRAYDDDIWLAVYDMKNLAAGADKTYTTLRENRSPREKDVLFNKTNVLSRQFFQLLSQSGVRDIPAKTICLSRVSNEVQPGDLEVSQ